MSGEPRCTGERIKPDEEYLYLPYKDKVLKIPKYSKPLPTKYGYQQFIFTKQQGQT